MLLKNSAFMAVQRHDTEIGMYYECTFGPGPIGLAVLEDDGRELEVIRIEPGSPW